MLDMDASMSETDPEIRDRLLMTRHCQLAKNRRDSTQSGLSILACTENFSQMSSPLSLRASSHKPLASNQYHHGSSPLG